jgi:2-methylcitrate dehydratase PrpD
VSTVAAVRGSTSFTGDLAQWASELDLACVPARVLELAKSQVLSQLACARAGLDHPLGAKVTRALGSPLQGDPKLAACTLAALTGWLNFDDSSYGGHLSHSTVNVPLAYARTCDLDGAGLLTAIIVANECAARVTAAATLGGFRGQAACYTHLAGAISGRLRAERAPARRWVDAFGLAFTMPPWTLYRGFLGSDGKVLSAATPVRAALDACDCAAAGLGGAPDILEHPQGFLRDFASVPLPEAVTAGLGRRWHTETLSFKVRPGIPGVDAAVDCATLLHDEMSDWGADDIAEVVVHCAAYTVAIDKAASVYMDGSRSPISALTFSASYAVATALLHGDVTPADFAAPRVEESRRWALAGKVHLKHDEGMTRRSRLSTAPLGEALREAGATAAGAWLTSLGTGELGDLLEAIEAPSESFEHAEKVTPARVTIRLADGRTLERMREIPLGAAGPDTRRRHRELVRTKFTSCGGPPQVADMIETLEEASAPDVARMFAAALRAPVQGVVEREAGIREATLGIKERRLPVFTS